MGLHLHQVRVFFVVGTNFSACSSTNAEFMRSSLYTFVWVLVTGIPPLAQAQHHADKWYFGSVGDGLDFTGRCDPLPLSDGAMNGFEGCATMSDEITGDLLFYTNSANVWNSDHIPMPNGDLQPANELLNQNTITQAVIVPRPMNGSQYYIFTNQVQCGFFGGMGVRMACVDMDLQDGMGDVLFKDSIVYGTTVSEKVIAIPHSNGVDTWVVGHEYPDNRFFALRVDASGIVGPAAVSIAGKVYGGLSMDCIGEMKASPDGSMIAVVTSGQPDIELFNFDQATGTLTAPLLIEAAGGFGTTPSNNSWWYGVAFSADNSKLYAGRQNFDDGTPSVIQADVSSGDQTAINASLTSISTLSDVYSLQLAPNGRIYLRRAGHYLGAINQPNNAGIACDLDPQAIDFGHEQGLMGTWGLNNFIAPTSYPCSITGLEERTSAIPAWLAPNPIQRGNTAVLHLKSRGSYRIRAYDACMREVGLNAFLSTSGVFLLDCSSWPEGAYFLHLEQGTTEQHMMKLIIAP